MKQRVTVDLGFVGFWALIMACAFMTFALTEFKHMSRSLDRIGRALENHNAYIQNQAKAVV